MFEDNNRVIRICKSKNRQFSGIKKRTKGQAMVDKTQHNTEN